MGLKNTEVELKFRLLNPEEAIVKLNSVGVLEKDGEYQKDSYYIPSHRDFTKASPISEWLRLRDTEEGSSITYKKWHFVDGNRSVSNDEFETTLGDSSKIAEIFERLDFKRLINVEKKRTTWRYKDSEIALDVVTELGTFVELEAKGDFDSIEHAKEHLYFLVKELGLQLGEQSYKGYPHLLLEQKGLI